MKTTDVSPKDTASLNGWLTKSSTAILFVPQLSIFFYSSLHTFLSRCSFVSSVERLTRLVESSLVILRK